MLAPPEKRKNSPPKKRAAKCLPTTVPPYITVGETCGLPKRKNFAKGTGEHSSPLREINNLTAMRIIHCVANKRLAPWVIPHKGGEMSAMQTKGTARPRIQTESGEGLFFEELLQPLRLASQSTSPYTVEAYEESDTPMAMHLYLFVSKFLKILKKLFTKSFLSGCGAKPCKTRPRVSRPPKNDRILECRKNFSRV